MSLDPTPIFDALTAEDDAGLLLATSREPCPLERLREAVVAGLANARPDASVLLYPIMRTYAEELAAGHDCAGSVTR